MSLTPPWFAVNLNSPALSGGASVSYKVTGTATSGSDFKSLSGTAFVPEGKQQVFIPVETINDLIAEGAETIQISLNSGSGYGLGSASQAAISITDNDTAGISITPVRGSTTEAGGQAVFEAVLESEPTNAVTLNLASNNTNEGTVAPASLTFNSNNWKQKQTFTVTGVDDATEDRNKAYDIVTSATSNDPNYNNISVEDVAVTNVDDEGYTVLITPSDGSTGVSEAGNTDSYDLALSQTPTGNVEITVTADEQSEISTNGVNFAESLTVTRRDTTAQTITVRAKDDTNVEGTHTSTITHQISGIVADENYPADLDIADVNVQITDNDTPTVSIVSTSNASEQSVVAGAFNLALSDAAPTGGITVNYSVDNEKSTATSADYQPLAGNIYIPEGETGATINLIPVQDEITETESVTITLDSGTGYQLETNATSSIQLTDDDVAGVRISESGNQTNLVEGQKTDTYSVRLTSQPSSDVTINFNTEATQIQNIQPVTFTAANWNTPQTVTVNSVDDDMAKGDRTSTITHTATSSDGNYSGIAIANVTAKIADNDKPGIVITNATNLQLTEGGDSITYSISLASQPTSDVTINFNTGKDINRIESITFTSANWNTPQTLTLTATVDTAVEDTEIINIAHTVTSNDAAYNGLTVDDVRVAVNELAFDSVDTASGLNTSLSTIEDSIDEQLAAIELPFIGSFETLAPDFIGSFKDTLINEVQTSGNLNLDDLSKLVETTIEDALDVDATVNTKLSLDEATFDLTISKTYELASLDLDADLGLPGLGIEVEGSGDLSFDYEFGLGFGISQDLGFFIDTDKTKFEAEVALGLSDDFKAQGNLGFLKLDIENDSNNPTAAKVGFELGLNDLDNSEGIKIFDADGDRQLDDNEPSTKVDVKGTVGKLTPQPGDPLDKNSNNQYDEEQFNKNEGVYSTTTKRINGTSKDVYFFDGDRDGRLDTNEPFVTYSDGNNNHQLDDGELSGSYLDENNQFKLKKTTTGTPQVYFDKNNNNLLDNEEEVDNKFDRNNNLVLDADETIEGEGAFEQGVGVAFLDQNGNGQLDANEPYVNSDVDSLSVNEEKVLDILTDASSGKTFIDLDGDGKLGEDDPETQASNADTTFLDFNDNQEFDEDDIEVKVAADAQGNDVSYLDLNGDNSRQLTEPFAESEDDPLTIDDEKITTATVNGKEVSYLELDLINGFTDGDVQILIKEGVKFADLDGDEEADETEPQAKPNNDFSELDRTQPGTYIEYTDDGDRLTLTELTNKPPVNKLFEPSLAAGVNLGLSAKTSVGGDTAFPAFNFDLAGEFPVLTYQNGQLTGPQAPTIAFNNVELDLGSFLTDFAEPVIGKINDIIDPFRPVIKFLNTDTKLFGKKRCPPLYLRSSPSRNRLQCQTRISHLSTLSH